MGIKLNNFNKIIDLYFYQNSDDSIPAYIIQCPHIGRKPKIQITGAMLPSCFMSGFEIKISNLYLDLTSKGYSKVKVVAGYTSQTVTFEGDIWYMYKESPGPESITSILCQVGKVDSYLSTNISGIVKKGVPLFQFLTNLCSEVKLASAAQVSSDVSSKPFPIDWYYTGTVLEVLNKLTTELFNDLIISPGADTIYAYKKGSADVLGIIPINILSTPPQLIGDGAGSSVATLTAPWNPTIKPGDIVSCPARFYKTGSGVGFNISDGSNNLILQVNTLNFQFSTVGNMNSMVIQGTGATGQ